MNQFPTFFLTLTYKQVYVNVARHRRQNVCQNVRCNTYISRSNFSSFKNTIVKHIIFKVKQRKQITYNTIVTMKASSIIATTIAAVSCSSVNGFTPSIQSLSQQRLSTAMFGTDDITRIAEVERGVSVDQDGKSNVWAIEPKVEVDSRSSEEKGQSVLIAGGGIAAVAVFAAFVLTNLPDPNQF